MADKKTWSGLTKRNVTLPANSLTTVDYLDTKPNYFRVQNNGGGMIYCGVANMPTATNYDFSVAGHSMKMYTDPFNRNRLYIYNPTSAEISAIVVSFAADFEPLALAFSEIEVTIPETIQAASSINSFSCSLPSGSATIGKVGLAASEKATIEQAAEKLGQLVASTSPENAFNLSDIIAAITWAGTDKRRLETWYLDTWESTATAEGETVTITNGYLINNISYFANDGTTDITLVITGLTDTGETYPISITVKAGEALENIRVKATALTVTGASPFRCGYNSILAVA